MKTTFTTKTLLAAIIFGMIVVSQYISGCKVRPGLVATDRMDYGQVIAESWKRQTLLNVVRLRYADAPIFLEITSIINSHSVGGNVNAGAGVGTGLLSDVKLNVGGSESWSNTPTVSYQPVLGDKFTKSMLQPLPPSSVFQLIQGGWPVDLVLGCVTGSINGLRNASYGNAADSGFTELVKNLVVIQRAGRLGLRVEAGKDGSNVIVILPTGAEGSPLYSERKRIRELLNLEEGINEFQIEFGLFPKNNHGVAILSRSMLEIMLQLGFSIELPPEHIAEGRVLPGIGPAGSNEVQTISRIHSGSTEPKDAYVAVNYKKYWYWIDDTDLVSKRYFTFLMLLFSLAETGQSASSPVVTVPSR